ncbi:BTB/POZ domain-containing protein [Ditylenchus destructor]|uniref:BTB/POZ domain-containing protein n=1 Tax=Ditylenchus destructor TaxID=166010 RepID=A0AAD4QXX0_9BILA|nr:BTB/POZ domain-containing protein [Ditylenchus destructor]
MDGLSSRKEFTFLSEILVQSIFLLTHFPPLDSYPFVIFDLSLTFAGIITPGMSISILKNASFFNFGSSVDKAQLFSESSPFQSDCVISFKDEKEVHVNKNLLSLHSDWWKDTFAKYNDRVPLLNVDYNQFLDLLSVIYPTGHPITARNVETLSKLAHDFKMTELLKRCDIFLMANSAKFGRSKLLLWAQNYNLERLQAQCISEYKSLEDIKEIKTEPEYADLHDRTKRMLLDKILGISQTEYPEAPMPETSASSGVVTSETRASQILDKLASLSTCRSDIVLVVGNAKIPAHKQFLSYFSEFFDKMFESGLKESRENEITIEEVRYEEMVELLSVIYPSNYAINETNIATIVKLADRFVMPIILDRCKQELKNSSKIKGALKLWLAQRYNFSDLQEEFLLKCNSIEDVKKLKDEPEFALFDDHMRALILESITR